MVLELLCQAAFTLLAACAGFVSAGMPLMLCGHFFLKLSHAAEYQSAGFTSSIQVGALGGLLMTVPVLIVKWAITSMASCSMPSFRTKSRDNESVESSQQTIVARSGFPFSIGLIVVKFLAGLGSIVALGAGIGYSGSAVLRATGHDTLETLAATRAGTVGASILGPGAIVVVILLTTCCTGSIHLLLCCLSRQDEKAEEVEEVGEQKV